MITLRQLHYFVTVAQEGQVTSAASKLYVAQPALSQAIAQLEQQVGVRLFERHARGVSLTPAGDAFFAKASAAVSAASEAELLAQSLVRASSGVVELGFMGTLPMLEAPDLFATFSTARPDVEIVFRELPFPSTPTSSWIEAVDVAMCYAPTPHPHVQVQPLRSEPRAVLASTRHALAARNELAVADVLDERFPGVHPGVDEKWAGVWTLDDHRGGPAPNLTHDRTLSPQETNAVVLSGRAITVVPAARARDAVAAVAGLASVPLIDADPVTLSLVWRRDNESPLLGALLDLAITGGEGRTDANVDGSADLAAPGR